MAESALGYRALVRDNRNFRFLWFGQIVSLLGDWFNLIASAALVGLLTGSGLAVGGLFVVRMLAPFLISPLAGMAADRFDRRRLLIFTDLARAGLVMGFLLVRDPQDLWLLYVLTAAQLALGGVFFPARNAILPDLVSPAELGPANALSAATWSVMLALGAALGGAMAGQWGIYPAFVVDAVTFLLSAALIAQIRPVAAQQGGLGPMPREAGSGLSDGLRYLRGNVDLLVAALHKGAMGLAAGGLFMVVQVELAQRIFPMGEGGSTTLGMFYAVTGLGSGVGPIVARRFTGDRGVALRKALTLSYGLAALGLLLVSPLASLSLVLMGSLLRALAVGLNWVFSTQILLQECAKEMRGRVFGVEFALFTLGSALGAAGAGWLLDHTALGLGRLLGIGAGQVGAFGLLWMMWLRLRSAKGMGSGA